MQFGVNVPNFGPTGAARTLADLAHEAEQHGWDGFFLWDHIGADWGPGNEFADPWLALTAAAMVTSTLTLGLVVTPLPRRRPWKVAREAVTLDHLSGGRLILGVGIGSDSGQEFSCYGGFSDDKLHGAMLDEALEAITGLWSGEPYSFEGAHYQIRGARYLPTPVQRPRIPIWVAAVWPNKKPLRIARRWAPMPTPGRRGGRRAWRPTTRSPTCANAFARGRRSCQPPRARRGGSALHHTPGVATAGA